MQSQRTDNRIYQSQRNSLYTSFVHICVAFDIFYAEIQLLWLEMLHFFLKYSIYSDVPYKERLADYRSYWHPLTVIYSFKKPS